MSKQTNKLYVDGFDELVLMAVLRLKDDAYGVTIRQTVEDLAHRFTSVGAIYASLDRLEKKGFVTSRQGEPIPERGGRARRYFEITGAGVQVLREAELTRTRLLRGVDLGLEPVGGSA